MKGNDVFLSLIWVLSFVLIGVPSWWYTTAIYRADIPYQQIAKAKQTIDINILVKIHVFGDPLIDLSNLPINPEFDSFFSKFKSKQTPLKGKLKFNLSKVNHPYNQIYSSNPANPNEILQKIESETNVQQQSINGKYNIFVVCNVVGLESNSHVYVGAKRSILVRFKSDCIQTETLNLLVSVLKSLFIAEQREYLEINVRDHKDRARLRVVKYSTEYEVTFSLLIGDPSSFLASWKIEEALNKYIHPFTNTISKVSNLTITSQILYYTSLPITPTKSTINNHTTFTLDPKSLRHFINSAEWNLASAVNPAPPLNFLLYVPSKAQSSLHILRSDGNLLLTNAFLIPRWGGIIVSNPTLEFGKGGEEIGHHGSDEFVFEETFLKGYMEIFVGQLRGLLGVDEIWKRGIKDNLPNGCVMEYSRSPDTGITLLELDRLVRTRTLANLEDSINTLGSLSVLIQEIEGMTVQDKIHDLVVQSLDNIEKAIDILKGNVVDYEKASLLSQRAIVASEKAFFDPSLVSMLYFPTEHKYAVYMPFFLPAFVHVGQAIIKFVKERRKKIS